METDFRIQGYRCKKIRCFKRVFKEWIKVITELVGDWDVCSISIPDTFSRDNRVTLVG